MSSSSKGSPAQESIDRPYTPQGTPGRRRYPRASELSRDVLYTPHCSSQQSPTRRSSNSRFQGQGDHSSPQSEPSRKLSSSPLPDSSCDLIGGNVGQSSSRSDQFRTLSHSPPSSHNSNPRRQTSQRQGRLFLPAPDATARAHQESLQDFSKHSRASEHSPRSRKPKRHAADALGRDANSLNHRNSAHHFSQRSARRTFVDLEPNPKPLQQPPYLPESSGTGQFAGLLTSGHSVQKQHGFPGHGVPYSNQPSQAANSQKVRPNGQRGSNPLRNPDGSAAETIDECYNASIAWVRKTMRRIDTDDDVQALTLRFSLHHPHTNERILLPVRGSECTHVQCFDSIAYIRQHTPDWACPVCARRVTPKMLYTCAWFQKILSETNPETECVEVDRYGNFKEVERVVPDTKDERKNVNSAKTEKTEIDDGQGGAIDLT